MAGTGSGASGAGSARSGPLPGGAIAGLVGRRAVNTGVRNVAEYLAHESGDLVPRAEAEDFYRSVERLREDLDRLEARTRLIEQADSPPEDQR